jgi:hypothetical protein
VSSHISEAQKRFHDSPRADRVSRSHLIAICTPDLPSSQPPSHSILTQLDCLQAAPARPPLVFAAAIVEKTDELTPAVMTISCAAPSGGVLKLPTMLKSIDQH